MSEETKTVTFDLDYQGDAYQTRNAAFARTGDRLLVCLRNGGMVEFTADDAESLGTHLIAAAEGIRRLTPGDPA